jgi:hypothetical protein
MLQALAVADYPAVCRSRGSTFGERCGGRVLSLLLSPWVIGYPHRIAALERILACIMKSDAVWPATGIAIAGAYKRAAIDNVQPSQRQSY